MRCVLNADATKCVCDLGSALGPTGELTLI